MRARVWGAFVPSPADAPRESPRRTTRVPRPTMRLTSFLERRSRHFVVTAALLLVALLGVLDYLNGPDFSTLIFYVIPVFIAAWYAGRGAPTGHPSGARVRHSTGGPAP